ncbi:hypothetical protein E4U43_002055 [Claviceps pusilla]|uniref:Capsular associated protein n=1 Tax=Claviceps pusilla TaxID=123648 RepID=A0A9P7T190_9HYPO|nr:hypothetical protein E4U43_002055 [Claviceps pusilla]
MRLEVFNHANYHQQCYSFGSWLCLSIALYNTATWRGNLDIPASDDLEDPWRSIFDDLKDWMSGPRAAHCLTIVGVAAISIGTYVATYQVMGSTYICFTSWDSRPRILILQSVSLILDLSIIINLWRVLVWTKGFKSKLRMLSKVFIMASTTTTVVWMTIYSTTEDDRVNIEFGHLYGVDILLDSFAITAFAISATNWAGEVTPMVSLVSTTSLIGIGRSFSEMISLGDWMHLSRSASLLPLFLIVFGFITFVYVHDMRFIVVFRRTLFVFVLFVLLITCTIFTLVRPLSNFEKRHPVNDLIYEARAVHDRWLLRAATSRSIVTAVTTYEERHKGRAPPPKFDEWYRLASGSAVIDDFHQVDKDLEIFWTMTPTKLRKRVELVTSYSGVGSITVKDGQVIASDVGDGANNLDFDELINMVKKFSRHLPDMLIPVNLNHVPRVLPSWDDKRLHNREYLQSLAKTISMRSGNMTTLIKDVLRPDDSSRTGHRKTWHQTSAAELRHMYVEACPSTSLVKVHPHLEVGSFCSACAKPHSRGQFLDKWITSFETCNQPDLAHLHSFFMTDPVLPPIQELVPLFSSFKTEGFSDILLPLTPSHADEPDRDEPFFARKDSLFWSTTIGIYSLNEEVLRGSHKSRLLHLINNPSNKDRVTMVLPLHESEESFKSESVLVTEANYDLPFNAGVRDYDSCVGKSCDLLKQIYGKHIDGEDPMNYRYVLLTDEDDSPPKFLLKILRSQSVPFISTIFQTWYSERLTPWLHFVPIDIRYHALHATVLYFTGTANRAKMNGIDMYVKGRPSDAEWIARQGQRWAARALRKDDQEIYLFRLLLEWGRLIDDQRDNIGYRKDLNGEYRSDDWTQPSQT